MKEVTVLREGCLPLADEGMHRTIARIRPLVPAVAAVVASVLVSFVVLRPPGERLLPGAAPADRGHVGALVLPAPRAPRPVVHRQPAPAPTPAAPLQTVGLVPTTQTLKPPAARHKPAPRTKTSAPKPKPKPKPTTPTPNPAPPPPVATPTPAPPPTHVLALKRHGNGPPAHSNSRLLRGKPGNSGHHGPPPGHGKPKPPPLPPAPAPPPPPAAAQVQPAVPPATPPGHGGTPPGQGGTPPGQGGTPPGHQK